MLDRIDQLSFQPASSEERALLQNLTQFYYYDFSEVLEMHVRGLPRYCWAALSPKPPSGARGRARDRSP